MSEDEPTGEEATGVVTEYYANADEPQSPHRVYLNGQGSFSTFDDATAEPFEEGVKVRFRYVENNGHRNIVKGSVEVVDTDPDIETSTETDGHSEFYESARDRAMRCNVALKQARELCQPMITEDLSEERFREVRATVEETADVFAAKLREMQQDGGET